jgi:tetratricopeptide (TPR) repeat protein
LVEGYHLDMAIQLFISCVSNEFRGYRDELRRLLTRPNVVVHVQEDFIATGTKTLDKLDDYISGCDAVIHLVGDMTGAWATRPSTKTLCARYGDLVNRLAPLKPSIEKGDPPLSYTQWEAYLAIYHDKPLVIAVPEPGTPRDPKYRNRGAQRTSQRRHLERLRRLGHYVEITFGNGDQLAAGLFRSKILDLLIAAGIVTREKAAVAGDTEPSAVAPDKPNALPYPSIGALFKGREQIMADLRNSLARTKHGHSASVVSNAVYGLGGIGKTRLAIEYGWLHSDDYNALLFAVANTPDDLRRNLAALAGPMVLNLPEQSLTDEEARVAAVVRWLQQHPGWLLIIDNADTQEAAAAVENNLPKLRGGHILITSRLAEWSGSVRRFNLDLLSENAANAFLLERTATDRRKTPEDGTQAQVLARELGYLALALEQAGAYINRHRLSFGQYLAQWHSNRDKVSRWFDERVMKYPRSVAATWQTSVNRLGRRARRLLEWLAWLAPDPIPESALEIAVHGDDDRVVDQIAALAELEAYSLVTRSRDTATFTIHRLVQDVTRRSLGERKNAVLTSALNWMDSAFRGNVDDLRLRPKLELLAPHVRAATNYAHVACIFSWNPWLLIRLGDLLRTGVPLADVEPIYRRALAMCERLFKANPNNPGSQYNLGISKERIGNILMAQGDLTGALNSYEARRAIVGRLAAVDPNNFTWQRDLAVSHGKVGDMLLTQGNLSEALKCHKDFLTIAERLVEADPKNVLWQRDLSVSYNCVGDVLEGQGDLPEALKFFRLGLVIAEQLANADPNNAGWQRDLSVSYEKIGKILVARGDLPEALKSFRDSLAIRERLAKADANNAEWQRDLSVSYEKIGDVLVAQGNLPEALKFFRLDLVIAEQLANADPNNTSWQRDLSVSYENIGDVLAAQGNLPEALKSFRDSLAIRERLARANPANATWQLDVVASHWRLAQHGGESASKWKMIVKSLRALKDAKKLTAEQERWLPEAEKRLSELAK